MCGHGSLGSNGNERIRAAIENAKLLEKYWKESGKDINKDIMQMNPAVDIYKLVERLLDEIVYLCGQKRMVDFYFLKSKDTANLLLRINVKKK